MSEDKEIFPKALKIILKGFLFSVSLTIVLWLMMILGFSVLNIPIKTDVERILLENIRLNGIVLGFTMAIFAFVMERLSPAFHEWALTLAIATLTSFVMSIFFGFMSVLSSSQFDIFPLVPISFTIIGIISDMMFLLFAFFRFKAKR